MKEEEVADGRPTLTQVQHGHPKLDFDLFFSAQCKRKTQMLFPSYCNIHLTLTIIMRYFPVALYCTSSNGLQDTLCQASPNMAWNKKKANWQILIRHALETQLEMMQSLQPNTL